MNSWNLILATVVIFGAGVITGGMLVDHSIQPPAKSSQPPPVVPVVTPAGTPSVTNNPPVARSVVRSVDLLNLKQPEMFTHDFVQKLDDRLQLTPVQRDAIQKIMAAGQEQIHGIVTNCTGQYHQEMQEVRQHIREQLNPDQLKEFEKLLKQMHPPARKTTVTNVVAALPVATNAPAGPDTNAAAH